METIQSGLLIYSVISLLLGSDIVDPNPPDNVPEGYKLVFSDEFDDTALNLDKWALGTNANNIQRPTSDSVYTMNNISLRDGNLVFTQRREEVPLWGDAYQTDGQGRFFDYSSGGLHVNDSFMLKNNMYIEMRVKLPDNDAGLGAFWMYSYKTEDWSPEDLLEIDLFEFICNRDKTKFWSGLWWHDYRVAEVSEYLEEDQIAILSDDHVFVLDARHRAHTGSFEPSKPSRYNFYDYITFGFKVTDDTMEWYLVQSGAAWRSKPYMVFKGGEVHSPAYWVNEAPNDTWLRYVPKNLNAQIKLAYQLKNMEWSGGPVNDNQLPSEMLIDYIRVYQIDSDYKENDNNETDGHQFNCLSPGCLDDLILP